VTVSLSSLQFIEPSGAVVHAARAMADGAAAIKNVVISPATSISIIFLFMIEFLDKGLLPLVCWQLASASGNCR
jgi:hypothetical protein